MTLHVEVRVIDKQFFCGPNRNAKPWADTMNSLRGQWVRAEMEHPFIDQWNTETARVLRKDVDGLRMLNSWEEYKGRVIERMMQDWPGTEQEYDRQLEAVKASFGKSFYEGIVLNGVVCPLPVFNGD